MKIGAGGLKSNIKKSRNIFIYLLSFLASGCGIALNFVLARFLQAEQYGRLQYFVALATTISQFLILGMNSFLIREAKNDKQRGDVFSKCVSLYLAIIIFFIPIVYYLLSNHFLVSYSNIFIYISVLIMSVLMGLNALITSYYQGSGKFHLTIIFENLIPKLVLLSIAIIFIIIGQIDGLTNYYLVFYICVYSIISIPLCVHLFKKVNFNFDRNEIKSIIFFFGVTVTYSLGNNLTKVLQGGLYKNEVALGIISASISIVGIVRVFTNVLDNMIKPIFSKKKREGDLDGLIEAYRFDTRMNSYVSVPMYLFFVIHPQQFLLLFGESFVLYPNILVFIALANGISDLTGPNGSMLAMTGKEKWELFNGFLYFGIYLLSVFIFSFDKIYGLTIALLVGQFAVNAAKYIEVWRIYKTNPLNLKSILTIAITIVSNFAFIFVLRYLNVNFWLWMIIAILDGIMCVVLNCFLLSLYRVKDFKSLLSLRV